ncbi:DNA-binding XRE family transcriptional regulator [Scopulibacillus darangshiensis]|uniref:DNA-binding XRE family transcriptional regulator n=1 Tax=Scopulibacillus darangshiensis TaxID=442528 RepID=A0A4R2PAP3_9BACL|nr:helix-turn-helix transcriptional regulator [Scopulibacillus darangshiensis]TCP32150.1 DNA-binding XRE family transcriptional regulator [Scopulibacillus darangshiensis]
MLQITLGAARHNAGYTLKEAACLFGIHPQTLSSYEKDSSKVSFEFIEDIPRVYHMPKSAIFFGNEYEFIRTIRNKQVV